MKRFKNILLYTNSEAGSRFALNRAVDLADRNEGRLTVASVLAELPRKNGDVLGNILLYKAKRGN